MTTASEVTRAGQRRVGIMLHETSEFRPLLTLGAIGDGGIILIPKAESPTGWSMTARPVGTSSRGEQVHHAPPTPKPKLHYHRSGLTTLQPPGGRRLSVQLPPLISIDAQQIFYFRQADPGQLPAEQPRESDSFVVSHEGFPAAVAMTGILFQAKSIPYWRTELMSHSPWGMLRGKHAEPIVSLTAHGLDVLLVLRYQLDWRPMPEVAATSMAGFCGPAVSTSPLVALSSHDGIPGVGLMGSHDLPQFPSDPGERTDDRRRVVRRIGEPPNSSDPV